MTTLQQRYQSLADATGVPVSTVEMLARQVASEIEQDRAAEDFIGCTEADQIAIAQAYIAPASKTLKALANSYLTNPSAAEALQGYVLSRVQGVQS